jgi:Ca2+-binding EF-hand superfamily protein
MRRMPVAILAVTATLVLVSGAPAQDKGKPYDPRAAFAETDKNRDGQIDLEEFHARLVEVFFAADRNKDGFLSVEEFMQLPYPEGFKDADKNGDGRLSLPEFVSVRFRQFEDADTNHDGQLSLEEVVAAFEGRKEQ